MEKERDFATREHLEKKKFTFNFMQAPLTDSMYRFTVRQQAKSIVEDSTTMKQSRREAQQVGQKVLQAPDFGALWV